MLQTRKYTTNQALDMTPRLTSKQIAMFEADKSFNVTACVIWIAFGLCVAVCAYAVMSMPAIINQLH